MIWCEVPGCKDPATVHRGTAIITIHLCAKHDEVRREL